MLYKKMFIQIIAITVIYIAINNTLIYATDANIVNDSSNLKTTDEQFVSKITDAQYASIEKILEYINKEIKSIDEKISLAKTLTEYEKYPAVRLNIDTPYFGISSIVDSKLKIRNSVSTVDIASGYSIKNIINKKEIKLESFEVSNITVITRDVKINKDMTSSDAQTCIFKLLDYLAQVKSVNKFLDKQLPSMITGYFTRDKTIVIDNINEQVKEIDENLGYSLNELSYINSVSNDYINVYVDTLYKYKYEIASIKYKVKSVLTSEEKLNEIYQNVLKLNEEIKLFRFDVNKEYLNISNNINLEETSYLIISKMETQLKYLQKYVENSKVEVTQEASNSDITNVQTNTSVDTIATQVKEKKYNEIYKISSEAIVQNMKGDFDKANIILDKVVKNNLITEENKENKEKLNVKNTVNELLQIYIGFLNKENIFLTENAKVNITEIKKSTDLHINSFEDVEYVYINLSDILTRISDEFESNSVISNMFTADNLKQVIDKVISSSKNFKEVKM